ncbi:tetratricopeptide repeat protein [Bosea sp. (in: a-proteobacteria)]|uniref:tetratricopeptide repeat protein n=1 Tax=Bosea sp. (in: a-proteobacteria) TaxID=1871050 RepID=UPI002734DD45|nr:tetratricopeptide repeat protein [Bosea sp. (in: a-proteobacteria)]MDP3408284.1 tetratricopeptide repeat protein [Bosea sp. (in: a-proteobacteria)]
MARIGALAAACLLLAAPAQAQSVPPSDDVRLAPCMDRQRPAAERARLCRALGDTAEVPVALRRQAREAEARALLEASDWDGLLRAADALLVADPADRLGHAMRGHTYLYRQGPGDAERARDAYTEGMKHAPNAYLFPNNRGIARSMLGDADGALADHSLALSLQGDYGPALLARSRLLNARGDHAAALKDIEAGLKPAPDSIPLLDEQSRALVGLGRQREAITALDKVTSLAPQRPLLHFRRGLIRAELGDNDGAIADFTREIAVSPELPGAYVQRGRLRLDVKKDDAGARADYDKAIAVAPAFAMGWSHRSRARLMAGDVPGAEVDAIQALKLDPRDPIAKLTLAGLADMRGAPEESVKLLDEVLAVQPAVVEVRLEQIALLMRLNRDEDALRSVRAGHALARANLDLIDIEAALLLRLRRIPEGKAVLDRAIADGHRRASIHANRAAFAVYLRDFSLAQGDVAAALALEPGHLAANALSGLLAVRARDWRKAEATAGVALASDPDHGMALAVKAEVLRQQGKTAEADRVLAMARRKDPRFTDLVRMIQER